MDANTSITGTTTAKRGPVKGSDRDGIRINDGGVLDLYINGTIVAEDDGGSSILTGLLATTPAKA